MNTDGFRVVLASQSPRRKELLKRITGNFETVPSEADENIPEKDPAALVRALALKKASEVYERLVKDQAGPDKLLVIGSDTVVAINDEILGKPGNEERAVSMLRQLSGRSHHVYTGVALIKETESGKDEKVFYEDTEVFFSVMTDEEIREYVSTGDPMDKAGAYGIQGPCSIHIEGIRGDYNNVVGFPVSRIYRELKNFIGG